MVDNSKSHLVLAYYDFTPLSDPHMEVLAHKKFLENRDIACRIYLSEKGINGQLSGAKADAEAYMDWMHSREPFTKLVFKIHFYHENVFPRQIVKYRKQLVALDEEVDLANKGDYLSPKEWKEMIEQEQQPFIVDVRNEYEWKVGQFKGSECPPCETFREFKDYAKQLSQKIDPEKTPVMMCCTGGIRCELFSALLRKGGFKKVYQLEGGIINYGLKEGSKHWLGKLFVFDDRLTVPISEEENPTIGKCHHCSAPNESYYNCANIDCNNLFLCCNSCVETFKGCCQEECYKAPRLRPYQHQNPHKPFKKSHHYIQEGFAGER